ncbi:hypothetical protein [Micromonospora endolithica]|uniref:Uncharacterized protein n=1 Tax=Micromonospora endolithica TaxID=230091 RepID=A0A3A9ZMT2_9ACTN|nr:hypothetical protein [Micromonospora endolithica]RKN49489.1 hypothetical protein D7223_08370 [Micromonospora endolithica]TWJ23693.1 hypothetical protein JD76_03833 [Micromonospora endolithica]
METVDVDIRVACPNLDDGRLKELADDLVETLWASDVESLRAPYDGEVPAGAKSGEALAIGALVVAVAPAVMEGVMAVVASWLSRQPRDVELEINGHRFRGPVTKAQRDQMLAAFLRNIDRMP